MWWQRLRDWLWPRKGVYRGWRYLGYRLLRLPDTPHRVAAGLASGVAVSFTPFIGFHFLLGFAVAAMTRGNLIASAIGTAVGNPWTFPFIFTLTSEIGTALLGERVSNNVPLASLDAFVTDPLGYVYAFLNLVFPLIVGGLPAAVIVWVLFYFGYRGLIMGYREARRRRLERRQATDHRDAALSVGAVDTAVESTLESGA